jgi:hypothetical protein
MPVTGKRQIQPGKTPKNTKGRFKKRHINFSPVGSRFWTLSAYLGLSQAIFDGKKKTKKKLTTKKNVILFVFFSSFKLFEFSFNVPKKARKSQNSHFFFEESQTRPKKPEKRQKRQTTSKTPNSPKFGLEKRHLATLTACCKISPIVFSRKMRADRKINVWTPLRAQLWTEQLSHEIHTCPLHTNQQFRSVWGRFPRRDKFCVIFLPFKAKLYETRGLHSHLLSNPQLRVASRPEWNVIAGHNSKLAEN